MWPTISNGDLDTWSKQRTLEVSGEGDPPSSTCIQRWLQLTKPASQSLDSYERRYCCNWIKNRLGYQLNVIRMGWTAGFSLHVSTLLTGLQMSWGSPPGRLQGLLKATRRLAQEAPGPGIPTTKPRSSLVRRRFQGREWAFQQEIMGYFSFNKKIGLKSAFQWKRHGDFL